jgi:hypothetical protein
MDWYQVQVIQVDGMLGTQLIQALVNVHRLMLNQVSGGKLISKWEKKL